MVAEPVAYDYQASAQRQRRQRNRVAAMIPGGSPIAEPNIAPDLVTIGYGATHPMDAAAHQHLLVLADQSMPLPRGYWDELPPADYSAKFRELSEVWHLETDHLSSPTQKAMHWAYQQIIGCGKSMLPYIFHELQERGGQWYWALSSITHASPEPEKADVTTEDIRQAWLAWGREHHYL